jgi:alpha-mannosidase
MLTNSPFNDAISQSFCPAKVGDSFGPGWSTYWIKINVKVPTNWINEQVVLILDPSCEALIWSENGEPLQGILGSEGWDRRVEFIITEKSRGGEVLYSTYSLKGIHSVC